MRSAPRAQLEGDPRHSGFLIPILAGLLLGLAPSAAWAQGAPPSPPGAALAEPGRLDIDLGSSVIQVGDRLQVELTAVWMGDTPSAPARFPTWQDTWGPAEVLDFSEPVATVDPSGRHVFRQTVTLTAWKAGSVELPTAEVVIPLEERAVTLVGGQSLAFEVSSLLPPKVDDAGAGQDPQGSPTDQGGPTAAPPGIDDPAAAAEPQPRPMAGPESLGAGRQRFLISGSALLVALALSLLLLHRRLQLQDAALEGTEEEVDPFTLLPPLEELLERLAQIDIQNPTAAHTGISMALRRLLARHLQFPAVESTTTEIRNHLSRQTLPSELVQKTLRLLQECDVVKFAGVSVVPAVSAQNVEQARSLGRRIDEILRPKLPSLDDDSGPQAPTQQPGPSPASFRDDSTFRRGGAS